MNKRIEEILLPLPPEEWERIKRGEQTIKICKMKPQRIFYPFRVIVYIIGGIGVVGKFDCDEIRQTIRPEHLLEGSCMTKEELFRYSRGRILCGWHIKEGSVFEYEKPIPLEEATGIKKPPHIWKYLNRDST